MWRRRLTLVSNKHQVLRLVRFSIVGLTVAVIYLVLFNLLRTFEMPHVSASTIAFLAAVFVQYLLQTMWTFKREVRNRKYMSRFGIMVGLGALIAAAITKYIGPIAGLSDFQSSLVVVVVLPVFNFLIMALWVYKDPDAEN